MTITSLTPAQQARIPEFARKWSTIGLSTQRADRSCAQAAIEEIYWRAKFHPPRVIWLPCPLSARLSAVVYAALLNSGSVPSSRTEFDLSSIDEALVRSVESAVRYGAGHTVHSAVSMAVDYAAHSPARSQSELASESTQHSANLDYSFDFTVDTGLSGSEYSGLHAIVRSAVCSAVNTTTRSAVRAAMKSLGDPWVWNPTDKARERLIGGSYPGFSAMIDYFSTVLGIPLDRSLLELSASCSHYWLLEGVCFAAERPRAIHFDELGRLHCATGPSISFPSGWGLWHWHGVRVERNIIEQPEKISMSRIEKERNAERRRVMIERYGWANYLTGSGAKLIHEDPRGRLWQRPTRWDGPLVMVEVRNSTPEPDGSSKTYFLRVPPHMRSASEAVAWTFGLTAQTYRPHAET